MSVYHERRVRAAKLLDKAGLGAAVFVPGPNFEYLTGVHLHLMERPTLFVLSSDGRMNAMMPSLEQQKWSSAMPDTETIYWADSDGAGKAYEKLADRVGTNAPLGVEGLRMRVSEYLSLAGLWSGDGVINADPALTELRLLKSDDEIAELRKAIEISEAALGEIYDGGIGGRSEIELASRLKSAMLAHGACGFAFEPIVLCGAEAANPHGEPGGRVIKPGQVLLIDFGASYGDMNADITRTVFCEHVSDEHAEIYYTVLAANKAGREAVKPDTAIGDVDAVATDVLSASRFSDMILHKTGHGLGREVHEAPQVMRSNRDQQRAGMVFTVEPGLYREGEIGVRIEDNVVVTETGHDCLTRFDRELLTFV